jgi:arylsulfatase A-like enzyme
MVDTLRTDRLHFDGYANSATPNFDQLQHRSTSFSSAYSTSSWTLPAIASLFLSQHASTHGVSTWGSRLSSEQVTFVESLRAAGYRTGGWTANFLLPRGRGLERGFAEYELVKHPRWRPKTAPFTESAIAEGRDLTQKALAWLGDSDGPDPAAPFFVYIHYMEPHTPYLCPPSSKKGCKAQAEEVNRRLLAVQWRFRPDQKALIQQLYDADIARMDAVLADLWRELETSGLLENTWVILTSDHGELFGKRGMYVHGRTLYQPLIHVPLLFSSPSRDGSILKVPVSLIDVAPTILDLAGVEVPPTFQGRSLRAALEDRSLSALPVMSELFPVTWKRNPMHLHLLAVVDGDTKLVMGVDGTLERFDLQQDPQENHPRTATDAELNELLAAAGVPSRSTIGKAKDVPEPSPEMVEELKALGYIQ